MLEVDEKRRRAEAAVIDIDETMKERDKKMRELEREVEMLKRKTKTAREDARLQAEIEIERLKTELECRTQLLNMRWQRHEEMMRESYDRQMLKGSVSTGQLPLIYNNQSNNQIPPPGLGINLMNTMQQPQHHHHQMSNNFLQSQHSINQIPNNNNINMTMDRSNIGNMEMPRLAMIGGGDNNKAQYVPEQHSPPLHINQKANKTSARSTASSMKSLGSTGSYNLNYQKQKRGMRNKNGKRK